MLSRALSSRFLSKRPIPAIQKLLGTRVYSTSPLPSHSEDPIPSPPPAPKGTPPNGNTPPEHFPQPDFPWLCGSDSARIPQYPYYLDKPFSFIKDYIPTNVCRAISRWFAFGDIQVYTTKEYFPAEFLLGAKLTLTPLCTSMSEGNREYLRDVLAADLYDRYDKELSELKRKGYSLNIEVPKVHHIQISNIWVTRGPKKAFELLNQYHIYRWMTMTVAVSKKTMKSTERSFIHDLHEGLQAKVDVVFDADVLFQLKRDNELVKTDFSRRPLVISFETPYFEPAEDMSKPWLPGHKVPNWRWKVCDIDDLLESERLESRKRIKRMQEESSDAE